MYWDKEHFDISSAAARYHRDIFCDHTSVTEKVGRSQDVRLHDRSSFSHLTAFTILAICAAGCAAPKEHPQRVSGVELAQAPTAVGSSAFETKQEVTVQTEAQPTTRLVQPTKSSKSDDDGAGNATSADEAAKELLNPNTSLASLTFRNQYRWYDGTLQNASEQSNYTLLFQPVFPVVFDTDHAGTAHKLFVRPAIPIQVEQPAFKSNRGTFVDASGLGDIGFDVAYGASWKGGEQFAAGVVGSLPTATGQVPGGNATLGPEIFTGIANEHGFFGGLLNHQWHLGNWSDAEVNRTTLQPIITFALPDNWAVGTTPIMSYDWVNNEPNIPLNGFVQRTLAVAGVPTKFQFEVNYFPKSWRPDAFGAEWFVALNITPVVPNPFQALVE